MFGPPTSFLLLFSSFTAPPLNQSADQRFLTRVRLGRTLRMALHPDPQTQTAAAASRTVAAARSPADQTVVHRMSFVAGKSLTFHIITFTPSSLSKMILLNRGARFTIKNSSAIGSKCQTAEK